MDPEAVKWPLITVMGCDGRTKNIIFPVKVSHEYSADCTSCSPRNDMRLLVVTQRNLYKKQSIALIVCPVWMVFLLMCFIFDISST